MMTRFKGRSSWLIALGAVIVAGAAIAVWLAIAQPVTASDKDDKAATDVKGPASIAFTDGQVWRGGRLESLRPDEVLFRQRNAVATNVLPANKIKALATADDLFVYDPKKEVLVSGLTRYKLDKKTGIFEPTERPAGKKAITPPELAIVRLRDGFVAKGYVRSVTSDEMYLSLVGEGPKSIKAADVAYVSTSGGVYQYDATKREFHFRTYAEICVEMRAKQAEANAKALQELWKGISTGVDLYLRYEDNQLRKRELDIEDRRTPETRPGKKSGK